MINKKQGDDVDMYQIPDKGGIMENRVAFLRKKHGMSQAELSERVGMKQPMLNRIEKQLANLTVQNAIRVAVVLNEPLESLWWETDAKERKENGFDFLRMLHDWQLIDLKDAIDAEMKRREEELEKDGE